MNIIKKLSLAALGLGLFVTLFAALPVSAETPRDSICQGVGIATGQDCNNPDTAESDINRTVTLVVNTLGFIVGIVAVIMIIIGGLKYITSGGDSSNISSAKSTILYAIIGLVVVALSQVIVRFVLNKTAPAPVSSTSIIRRV